MQALVDGAPKLLDLLGDASRSHFEGLQTLLRQAGIAWHINPRLVRGMDYYNRSVFEWTTERLGAQGTICAGGRYDLLVTQLGGPPTPAAGFALGVDRVALLVEQVQQNRAYRPADVYFMAVAEGAEATAMRLAAELRARVPGVRIRQHQGGGKMKAQIRKADASGADVALILGDDELRDGTLTLKWLRLDRPQETLPLGPIIERLSAVRLNGLQADSGGELDARIAPPESEPDSTLLQAAHPDV